MSFVTQGKGVIFGVNAVTGTPVSATIYLASNGATAISGYVLPTVNNYNLTHSADIIRTKDGDGRVDAVTGSGEYVEAQFELLVSGSSYSAAKVNATVPPLMSTVVIAGADVLAFGPFTDVINNGSDTKWIYEGGASVKATNDGHMVVSLPLKRYVNITGGTAVTY